MAGLSPRPTAAPPRTHHGDVIHFRLAFLGRGGVLPGSPLPGGAGGASRLLQGQVGVADVTLQGLQHLGREPTAAAAEAPEALYPESPNPRLSVSHICPSFLSSHLDISTSPPPSQALQQMACRAPGRWEVRRGERGHLVSLV